MSDLGQLLKKARHEKGISLEYLQETTKIRKTYLEAIEEGNYKVLPGNFYVRAFIKSYSEAVGLNPDEVLRLYRNVIPGAASEPYTEPLRKKGRKSFNTDRLSKWASTLLMWCFPILIAVLIYVFYDKIYEGKPKPVENETKITEQLEPIDPPEKEIITPPEPAKEPIDEKIVEEPPPEPEVEFVVGDAETYIYNVSNTDKIIFEINLIGGDCWFSIKEGNNTGKKIIEKSYRKGDSDIIELDQSLYVRMGNPGNVEIKVNGVILDLDKLKESNPWNLQLNLVKSDSTS